MTVPSTPRRAGPFYGNGSTTQFPFLFKVYTREDVQFVVQQPGGDAVALTLDVDYLVTLNANQESSPGGIITYPIIGSPLASGGVASIIGNLPYTQPTDLPDGGAYRARSVETMGDRIVMLVQQVDEQLDRTFTFPPTEGIIPQFPPISERANRLLGFDGNGQFVGVLPVSGSAAALSLDLADTSAASKGDALVAVKRLLAGAVPTTQHAWHEAQVVDAVAYFGMSTAASAAVNTLALQAAISAASAIGRAVVEVQAGTYALTAGTNFAATNVAIVGRGQVVFDFSAGVGVGFKIDGVAALIQGMRIENIVFKGGPSITEVFQSRRVVRSMFRNLEAREGTSVGFSLKFAVLNTYDHCIVSDDVGSMTTRPATYWKLDDDGTVDNHTQCNTFLNCEASGRGVGSTSTGWTLTNAILNVWIGGTAESCSVGIDVTNDVCRMNSWYGFDIEDNQTYDIRLKGVSNNFFNSFAQSAGGGVVDNVSISTGMNCSFFGGYYRKVNLGVGSSDTTFDGVCFDDNPSLGIQGTGRFKRYNCIQNTGGIGGAVTGVLRDVLGVTAATTISLSQGNTPAQTVDKNEATVTGRSVQVQGRITANAAGTAANSIAITLDSSFPAKAATVGLPAGTFMLVTTGGTIYTGVTVLNNATTLVLRTNASTGNLGINPAVTLAAGDILTFVSEYPLE